MARRHPGILLMASVALLALQHIHPATSLRNQSMHDWNKCKELYESTRGRFLCDEQKQMAQCRVVISRMRRAILLLSGWVVLALT